MELYVSIQNPAGWDEYDKWGVDELISHGYDGVILSSGNGFDGFVFEPTQLKSVRNKGTWNPTDPNIMR